MPWCITCAEKENPDWDKNPDPSQQHLPHKYISFKQYLKCKVKGHDACL